MTNLETAHVFSINGEQCLGICHHGALPVGVLVVVGGPQYRVGSHRQFVQLSRALAKQGVGSFRFDYRGMGDSSGKKQPFDQIDDDIRTALDTYSAITGLTRFVIWGLCDAASAAWIYSHTDDRVQGLVLMNPWLKNASAKGKAMLRHYYLQRLLSKAFWQKLLRGGVNLKASVADAKGFAKEANAKEELVSGTYQERMLKGAMAFQGATCLILSGNDLTAKEFEQVALDNKSWKKALKSKSVIHRVKEADHTFSNQIWKQKVEKFTADFVKSL